MKDGLIKITGEDHLYYDSITKQYKSTMHCPHCRKYTGCWCYPDYESVSLWDEEYPNACCSDRCFVLGLISDMQDIADDLGITIKPTMEEWNAHKIVKAYMADMEQTDFDIPSGGVCRV